MQRSTIPNLLALACVLALSAVGASASVVPFTAEDLNAGPGQAHPLSSAEQASFLSAASLIGSPSIITFESAPLGTFTTLVVAPGVSMTGVNDTGGAQRINNTPNFPTAPALDGFNTTPGGANYVEVLGGTLTFTFTNPIQFFGAYLTGVQTNFFQDTITFSDGSTETIDAPGAGTSSSNGALDFVGFTDAGKSISSVTITAGSTNFSTGEDFIGVDDVIYQGAVPEPSSLVLLFTGLTGIGLGYRRRFVR